jgi:hypothetical protein
MLSDWGEESANMADATVSVEELEQVWRGIVRERQTCKCPVCALAPDLREFVERKVGELSGGTGGRGKVGLNTLVERVLRPRLGLTDHMVTRHRDVCMTSGCGHYAPTDRPEVDA